MDSAVTADSFTSISSIAANPPTWPSDFPQHRHDSLTLYITRVPGSRDVFLTPLKPRERVVTAEDVQSSLYYVHINSADDVELLHSPQHLEGQLNQSPTTKEDSRPGTEFRSPTSFQPESAPPLPQRPQVPPALPERTNRVSRKPLAMKVSSTPDQAQVILPVLPPRPLPPLPDKNTSIPTTNVFDEYKHHRELSYLKNESSYPPTPIETALQEELDGSLTLVRREPSTSDQWNVASIYDSPVQHLSSKRLSGFAKSRVKKSGAPLHIDITNPAYLAFQSSGLSRSSISSDTSRHSDGTFRRRLYLPGPVSVDNTLNETYSMDAPYNNGRERLSLDMRRSGYCFKSPWEGECQFTTSASGRSLICRHTLAGQQDTEVSELRFNLPTSSKEGPIPQDRRRSYFADGRRHSRIDLVRGLVKKAEISRGSLDLTQDDIDAPDYSLGQEMAGGGYGGRQPKLGKLIIHPSGLAMLDLLVAANIGLWWRAWEKVG